MKLQHKTLGLTLVLTATIIGCSTKKDTFINRNWHAITAEYNTLYNGYNALQEGVAQLNATYVDNYWDILPVERMAVSDEVKLSSAPKNPNFERAEEKATKAIQKHGMEINNRERNPQIDEAFLLLGKSRYYDQRFIPALEAFNYILYKYPNSSTIAQAKIWREKVNLRLENEELALENLKKLLKQERLTDQDYADASAMMAQAYINLKYLDSAAKRLRLAAKATKNFEEKGRYYYIVGQLYNKMGVKDTANMAFSKVVELNRKTPRTYHIHAKLQLLKNQELTDNNKEAIYEQLQEMAENRENRPFLHKIYHEIANYHHKADSTETAITFFNKSLRASKQDAVLNALNYERLAEINFYNKNYKIAGAYYDSTLTNISENTRKFRNITKKRNNLDEVIQYESLVQKNDSILYLVNASAQERVAYFTAHIEKLKEKEAQEEAKREQLKQQTGFAGTGLSNTNVSSGDTFYFYNTTIVGYGKTAFKNKWGDRPLEDNWRLSNKTTVSEQETAGTSTTTQTNQVVPRDKLYDVTYYIEKIPTNSKVIDSLELERNFANYQLALIYKEKFKEYELAAQKLVAVLQSNPEEKLILPSKYNLYKVYQILNNPLAEKVKEDIVTNYPSSQYAQLLLRPENVIDNQSKNSPEALYSKLYKEFEAQNFEHVITTSEQYAKTYNGLPIAAKFAMLKAMAIGRLQGFEAFKEALNYVALNFPNNPEGKHAQKIIEEQLPKLGNSNFAESVPRGNYKLVFPFKKSDTVAINKLYKTLERSLKELRYDHLKLSKDIYNTTTMFVVVHGFKQKEYALGYAELLNINKDYKVRDENFVILSDNYKIVQIHKNLDDYLSKISTQNTN